MTTRQGARDNGKPSADLRLWPHFAAGWDGNLNTPIPCADCRLPAYVGLSPRSPIVAEVAHVSADGRWNNNVVVCCRTCNLAQRDEHTFAPGPGLRSTPDARAASRRWTREQRGAAEVERARRLAARRTRATVGDVPG
jgi:hypothetical protein